MRGWWKVRARLSLALTHLEYLHIWSGCQGVAGKARNPLASCGLRRFNYLDVDDAEAETGMGVPLFLGLTGSLKRRRNSSRSSVSTSIKR